MKILQFFAALFAISFANFAMATNKNILDDLVPSGTDNIPLDKKLDPVDSVKEQEAQVDPIREAISKIETKDTETFDAYFGNFPNTPFYWQIITGLFFTGMTSWVQFWYPQACFKSIYQAFLGTLESILFFREMTFLKHGWLLVDRDVDFDTY